MPSRVLRITLASIAGLIFAAGIAWWQINHVPGPPGTANIGGPFTLVEHTGRTVTDADYRGKYLLVYFGYTFCPDVCPTELQAMAQAMDRLGPEADSIQPLFITVDPERDTVPHMAEYVAGFHPRLAGLTGSPEQVGTAARAYRVYFARAKSDDPQYYMMDHTSLVYLMGPDGRFITVFQAGTSPEAMADGIRKHIRS